MPGNQNRFGTSRFGCSQKVKTAIGVASAIAFCLQHGALPRQIQRTWHSATTLRQWRGGSPCAGYYTQKERYEQKIININLYIYCMQHSPRECCSAVAAHHASATRALVCLALHHASGCLLQQPATRVLVCRGGLLQWALFFCGGGLRDMDVARHTATPIGWSNPPEPSSGFFGGCLPYLFLILFSKNGLFRGSSQKICQMVI